VFSLLKNFIFDRGGGIYLQATGSIVSDFKYAKYKFISTEEYKCIMKTDFREGMRIYWSEILYRAHIAAATSIIRSRRWLDGLLREDEASNFLVCAASLRGLLEAAADTSTSLGPVPESLAQQFLSIEAMLDKRCDKVIISSELEDALIHYMYARKPQHKDLPSSHIAKSPQEYRSTLERGEVPRVGELYSFLCDVTHPGATSVQYLLEYKDESRESVGWLLSERDAYRRIVSWLMQEFEDTLISTLMFAFNPGLVTLRILNYFSLTEIHTPTLANWNLDNIPLWKKCSQHLRNQGII
jgi:hypothetical protein